MPACHSRVNGHFCSQVSTNQGYVKNLLILLILTFMVSNGLKMREDFSFAELGWRFSNPTHNEHDMRTSTGRFTWILHHKLNYFICWWRDVILEIEEIYQTAYKILQFPELSSVGPH